MDIGENERAYFAYGSNLHPLRMIDRLSSNVRLMGTSELGGYKLEFSKRSRDGSAKCTISLSDNNSVWGAVYAISHSEKTLLDQHEGLGKGYDERLIMIDVAGRRLQAFTYVANRASVNRSLQPYCWYKKLVCAGGHHHRFPEAYLAALEATPFRVDPDQARRLKYEDLLVQLISPCTEQD